VRAENPKARECRLSNALSSSSFCRLLNNALFFFFFFFVQKKEAQQNRNKESRNLDSSFLWQNISEKRREKISL